MPIPLKGKRCPKGFQRTKPKGSTCSPKSPKRRNGQPVCPSMKSLARVWKQNKSNLQSRYKKTNNRTAWNLFIADKRRNC